MLGWGGQTVVVEVPGPAVVVVVVVPCTHFSLHLVDEQGSGAAVVVVVVPVVVVVVVVVVVLVVVVVVLAQPPTGDFHFKSLAAIHKQSPWHNADTSAGFAVVVEVVVVASTINSGFSLVHVPFLCRQT